MYKLLLLIPFLLLFTACTQQTRGLSPQTHNPSQSALYSLEALDARYRRGY